MLKTQNKGQNMFVIQYIELPDSKVDATNLNTNNVKLVKLLYHFIHAQ